MLANVAPAGCDRQSRRHFCGSGGFVGDGCGIWFYSPEHGGKELHAISNGQAAAAEVWRCFQWQGSSSCSWEIGHSRKAFYAHPVKDRERGGISTEQIDTHVIVIIGKIIGMVECSFDVIGR